MCGTSLVVQWLTPHLPTQGTWVPFLVREYKIHKVQGNGALKLPQETCEPMGHN